MSSSLHAELAAVLEPGEQLIGCMPVDGFHASKHNFFPTSPHVALTDRRLILLSRRGVMKKRFDKEASWPMSGFRDRMNTNEGTALGPFMYFLTLFTQDDETVSAAFKQPRDREEYRDYVVPAVGAALG